MAQLMMTQVTGFMMAEIFPTNSWAFTSRSLAPVKSASSRSSWPKARMTRTPVRFSRASWSTRSSRSGRVMFSSVSRR